MSSDGSTGGDGPVDFIASSGKKVGNVGLAFALAAVGLGGLAAAPEGWADNVRGAWQSPVQDNWPLIPIHALLTPDGRVLTFGTDGNGTQTGYFIYDVWDPTEGLSGGHITLPNLTLTDIFCAAQIILPDSGNVLIAGGDNWTGTSTNNIGNKNSALYRYTDDTLTRGNDMKRARWYGTATTLMNGEIYIQGGSGGGNAYPEVRQLNGTFRLLSNASTTGYSYYYPRNHVAPDGRIFGYDALGKMFYINPAGTGTITAAGQITSADVGRPSTAAMYLPGKILQISANNRNATLIDINSGAPVVTKTAPVSAIRAWANATMLPDGRVLVTGGSAVANQLVGVNNTAEIWDPDTGTWTMGATGGERARLYHSMAILLPDATVLVGGGGAANGAPEDNLHSEIYYPPYLYNASGGLASRPVINTAPDTLTSGQDFSIGVGSANIERVTLIKTGAVTHSVNMDQRFIELSFTASSGTLFVDAPARATDIPPGYYLLFVVNDNGVPSKGKMVRMGIAGSGGGGDTVAPSQPQNLTLSKTNGKPKLAWNASTDAVGVTGYAVYRSTNGTFGEEVVRTNALTWTDTAVQEGTNYTYAVKAYDAAGNFSSASALKSIVAFQAPTKPGSFGISLSSGDPRLNWVASTDNVGVVGYNIYRSTNGTMGSLFATTTTAPWVDKSAQAGVTYTYAVRARDAAGYLSSPTGLKSIKAK